MEKAIRRKLAVEDYHFSQEELSWLLDHLADLNPAIRDNLVYESLAGALYQESLTQEEEARILNLLQGDKGLDSGEVLARSFASLLAAIFLERDRNGKRSLEVKIRRALFDKALNLFETEKNYQAYDPKLGWIHTHAHEADFLAQTLGHPQISKEAFHRGLSILRNKFEKLEEPLQASEERRWAQVLILAWSNQLVYPLDLLTYLKTFHFSSANPFSYLGQTAFDHFLLDLYLQLNKQGALREDLKKWIEGQISY